MAIILIVGYLILIYRRYVLKITADLPIWYVLFVGIVVQFSWEAVLLVSGIRPWGANPLIFNSLLETNLGIPYLYFIQKAIMKRYHVASIPTLQNSAE